MRLWSLLKEDEFLKFISEYFPLYEWKYHRGQFGGWEAEYRLTGSDLDMWTRVDDDNYITEFGISTWANGFSHNKQGIRVRKNNSDKTVHQTLAVNSNGKHSWGAIISKESNYADYNQIYDEIHLFMKEIHPNESKRQERDRLLKSLI
jgi:hypothetical protein